MRSSAADCAFDSHRDDSLNPAHHLTEALTLNTSSGSIVRCNAQLALARLSEGRAGGMRVIVQVTNDLPEWAYRKHAGLRADFEADGEGGAARGREHATRSRFAQHGMAYDIDHPAALPYMRAFLRAATAHFGCDEAIDSWILGNEVNYYTTASSHATVKFGLYLRRRYSGRLTDLRRAWDAWEVDSFEAAGRWLPQIQIDEPRPELSVEEMENPKVRRPPCVRLDAAGCGWMRLMY